MADRVQHGGTHPPYTVTPRHNPRPGVTVPGDVVQFVNGKLRLLKESPKRTALKGPRARTSHRR